MGTYNASAYNDNHTLLKLILNIQDYLHKNPNVALYHTVGFQGTVATTSIPKDKVYGPVGSTNTPTAGDLILYALDLGQGFFQVGGADEDNYTGEYIGQTLTGPKGDPGTPGAAATIEVGTVTTGDPTTPAAVTNAGTSSAAVFDFTIPRGEKGEKGDPGTGYSQLTGLYFNRQKDRVTYSDGIAVFVGQFQLTTADGNSTFANGAITLPIVEGDGILIDESEDGRSLIIRAVPTKYTISGGYGHCENSNPATVADEGTAYAATITANNGYNFGSGYTLTVTMGGTDITSEVAVVSTDTISINIPSVTGNIYINCVAVEIPPKLATPAIAMNADGKTLEITDVENATSYDVYVDGALKTNVQRVTKHKVTFTRKQQGMNGSWQYSLTGGADWVAISQSNTPIIVENVSQIKFRTKSFAAGHPYETYMSWNNPTGRIDCTTGDWVVSDNITPTGDMSVIYYGDNNPV